MHCGMRGLVLEGQGALQIKMASDVNLGPLSGHGAFENIKCTREAIK